MAERELLCQGWCSHVLCESLEDAKSRLQTGFRVRESFKVILLRCWNQIHIVRCYSPASWPVWNTFNILYEQLVVVSSVAMEEIHFSPFFPSCLQDFKEQIIHHVATIVLIGFSWLVNYIRAGTLIMLVHDASDYLMEVWKPRFLFSVPHRERLHDDAKIRKLITETSLPSSGGVVKRFCLWFQSAKMFNYAGWRKTCNFIFTVFAAVFIVTRLVILPFWYVSERILFFFFFLTFFKWCFQSSICVSESELCPFPRIIHTTLVYPLGLYQPFFGFYFFNGLMCVLQVLQIFWAGLILRMVVKFLPGNVKKKHHFLNVLPPLSLDVENSPCANSVFVCVVGRTSSRMSVATKRRRSRTMTPKNWGKNPKTATCRMATPPSTTTTGSGSDWTRTGCVMTDAMVWPLSWQPNVWLVQRASRQSTQISKHACKFTRLRRDSSSWTHPSTHQLFLPHSSHTLPHFRPAMLFLQAALLIPG